MGVSPLALFLKRREYRLAMELLYGMIAYYGVTALMLWWDPLFCIAYWVYPHFEAIVLLCAISYLWHAFVEVSDPGNQYVNSVTILNGHDNVFNEDYHVVHHHSPSTHWTDAPAHFEKNRHHYAAVNATIFRDTEEGMLLKWLFENNWDKMAEHFVDLNGKMTREEKKALIIRRLSVVVGATGRDGKCMHREWGASETIRDWDVSM
jgi:fatty acid desaturase